MKLIRSAFSITCILFLSLFMFACKKDKKEEPDEEQVAKKSFSANVNGKSWTGKGSYMIAFGNNPQLFMLSSENDTSSFHIEFRANGLGTYGDIESGYYVSIPQQTIYKIIAGTVTLSEITKEEVAKGSFSFEAEDGASGKNMTVSDGKFKGVKGSGHW